MHILQKQNILIIKIKTFYGTKNAEQFNKAIEINGEIDKGRIYNTYISARIVSDTVIAGAADQYSAG